MAMLTVNIFPSEDNDGIFRVSPSGPTAKVQVANSIEFLPIGSKVEVKFPPGSALEGSDKAIDAGASYVVPVPAGASLGPIVYTVWVFVIDANAKDYEDNDPELIIEALE